MYCFVGDYSFNLNGYIWHVVSEESFMDTVPGITRKANKCIIPSLNFHKVLKLVKRGKINWKDDNPRKS